MTTSQIVVQKISKYIKLAKIVVVQVFGYVEDEWCFSSLNIMKSKLRKRLMMHLDVIIWMFTQKSYTLEIFPYDYTIEEWKATCSQYAIDVYLFFFDIGKQHFYFAIGLVGKRYVTIFPHVFLVCHLL